MMKKEVIMAKSIPSLSWVKPKRTTRDTIRITGIEIIEDGSSKENVTLPRHSNSKLYIVYTVLYSME
ncbi:hypothetical protein EYC80_004545 [Monilinia laxa]|uniref:Uncharacterized protein n=1 Tax=Monilinia laxa TaxID=61186 RepID=A0A5N6KHB5_MONLA|nr:hypothetical protein EYC80_004545 [Monilinia laxa]